MKIQLLSLLLCCTPCFCMEELLQLADIDYSPQEIQEIFNKPSAVQVLTQALQTLEKETETQQQVYKHFRLPIVTIEQTCLAQNEQENSQISCNS